MLHSKNPLTPIDTKKAIWYQAKNVRTQKYHRTGPIWTKAKATSPESHGGLLRSSSENINYCLLAFEDGFEMQHMYTNKLNSLNKKFNRLK